MNKKKSYSRNFMRVKRYDTIRLFRIVTTAFGLKGIIIAKYNSYTTPRSRSNEFSDNQFFTPHTHMANKRARRLPQRDKRQIGFPIKSQLITLQNFSFQLRGARNAISIAGFYGENVINLLKDSHKISKENPIREIRWVTGRGESRKSSRS